MLGLYRGSHGGKLQHQATFVINAAAVDDADDAAV
jgi:hypothetical protein